MRLTPKEKIHYSRGLLHGGLVVAIAWIAALVVVYVALKPAL